MKEVFNLEKKLETITEEKNLLKELLGWVRDLAIALVVVFLIFNFIGQKTNVVGKSMEPTLHDGDQLIIDKMTYRFQDVERFDIIVFPYEPKLFYIKRVIGMPGETISIEEGKVLVDGQAIDQEYGFDIIQEYGNNLPLIVPPGEYFVMGDNRNNSSDSRYQDVGTIAGNDIVGIARVRIWPLNDFGTLKED